MDHDTDRAARHPAAADPSPPARADAPRMRPAPERVASSGPAEEARDPAGPAIRREQSVENANRPLGDPPYHVRDTGKVPHDGIGRQGTD